MYIREGEKRNEKKKENKIMRMSCNCHSTVALGEWSQRMNCAHPLSWPLQIFGIYSLYSCPVIPNKDDFPTLELRSMKQPNIAGAITKAYTVNIKNTLFHIKLDTKIYSNGIVSMWNSVLQMFTVKRLEITVKKLVRFAIEFGIIFDR